MHSQAAGVPGELHERASFSHQIELCQKVDLAQPCPASRRALAMCVRRVSAAEPGRSLLVARAAGMPAVSGGD
jgi:hypothetical protein